MFKVVALLAIVGVASAGNIAFGYSSLGYGVAPQQVIAAPGVVAYNGADVAALTRNANIQATGAYAGAVRDAVNINNAILTRDAGAAVASAVDQANLAKQANTQAIINTQNPAVARSVPLQFARRADDAVEIQKQILTRDSGAAVAAAVDQANLAKQANTQALINAAGAQNAAVLQNQQIILARSALPQVATYNTVGLQSPVLTYGAQPLTYGAPTLAYGSPALTGQIIY